jgi:hypothetical protein
MPNAAIAIPELALIFIIRLYRSSRRPAWAVVTGVIGHR